MIYRVETGRGTRFLSERSVVRINLGAPRFSGETRGFWETSAAPDAARSPDLAPLLQQPPQQRRSALAPLLALACGLLAACDERAAVDEKRERLDACAALCAPYAWSCGFDNYARGCTCHGTAVAR